MEETKPQNGNGQIPAAVLQTVLDKFIKLTEQNSQSTTGMANAIETMATNITEMTDHLNNLERQIEDEQVAEEIHKLSENITSCLEDMKKQVSGCSISQLGFLADLCAHLEYMNQDPKELAVGAIKLIKDENIRQEDLEWALSLVSWVREHRFIISFFAGGLAIWIYLKAGVDTVGYLRAWLGK